MHCPCAHSHKVQLTQWPGEEPTSKDVTDFIEENEPLLRAQYAADLCGRTPAHLMHLHERHDMTGLRPVTGDEANSIAGQIKHNSMIAQNAKTNAARDQQLVTALAERSNDIATAISISMRLTAPLRLKRLLHTHAQVTFPEWYNGRGMWKDLVALRLTTEVSEEQETHDDEVDRDRKTHLPDGSSAQEYADKINDLQHNHLPLFPICCAHFPTTSRWRDSVSSSCLARTPARAAATFTDMGRVRLQRLARAHYWTIEYYLAGRRDCQNQVVHPAFT